MIKLPTFYICGFLLNEAKAPQKNQVVYLSYTLRSETNKSQYCY